MPESLSNKAAGLRCAALLKKRHWHRFMFTCAFCEISKNTFFNRTPMDDCFWLVTCVNTFFRFSHSSHLKVKDNSTPKYKTVSGSGIAWWLQCPEIPVFYNTLMKNQTIYVIHEYKILTKFHKCKDVWLYLTSTFLFTQV